MDSQSVKTTERGGVRGFDGHKRVKGRKRYILVDTLGIPIACRVEAANMSDQRGAERLLGGLGPMFPDIQIIMADAGHQSRKLARQLLQQDGWKLMIVKRGQRAFKSSSLSFRLVAISVLPFFVRISIPLRAKKGGQVTTKVVLKLEQERRPSPVCSFPALHFFMDRNLELQGNGGVLLLPQFQKRNRQPAPMRLSSGAVETARANVAFGKV